MGASGSGLFTALLGAAIKGSASSAQKKESNKILQKIGEMPTESVGSELLDNQTMARIGANNGLPSEQYNLAMKNIQRQQMNAIKAGQDRRMAGALIPGIQQATNDATLKLDAANSQARMNNQKTLMGINSQVAKRKADIYGNYIRNYYIPEHNYAMALKGAAYQNKLGAIEQGAGGIANFIGGMGGGSGSGGGSVGGGGGGMMGGMLGSMMGG